VEITDLNIDILTPNEITEGTVPIQISIETPDPLSASMSVILDGNMVSTPLIAGSGSFTTTVYVDMEAGEHWVTVRLSEVSDWQRFTVVPFINSINVQEEESTITVNVAASKIDEDVELLFLDKDGNIIEQYLMNSTDDGYSMTLGIPEGSRKLELKSEVNGKLIEKDVTEFDEVLEFQPDGENGTEEGAGLIEQLSGLASGLLQSLVSQDYMVWVGAGAFILLASLFILRI
jgi:hypothetical protein